MEPRPRPGTCAAAAALLFLLLLGARASTLSPRCDCGHSFPKRSGLGCCKGCPAGHYLKAPCTKPCGVATCLPCPQGTFLARENHYETRCARCQACDELAPQMALRNCSAVADTHCGCRPGWFMDCMVSQCRHGSPFRCHPCTDCGALHRHTQTPCSSRDTHCGTCLPGFYEYGKSCVSCPTSTLGSCPEPCVAVCGWRQNSGPALLVPPSSSEKVCPVQVVGHGWTSGSPQTQEAPCPEATWSWDQLPSRAPGPSPPLSPAPPAGSAAATLQPGPQLYDVMDAVPARRWKEFVRTLGLREAEIEAVEVEVGRFRDQQYEMLKRWRQQQHAGLGAVYAALERMGLDGCAEDLRSRLQRGP
ncbi:tumor necrosis factor receptor superfamily member 25 isoform 4-T4 [Dama dama]|uniref:tumor necrosis factor receptor superfamily member 25 isoform X4 n=1 Tax=Dama dama TaxID=30532 RepID=UPI002A364F26|nr:tumor necrosis factor receptor superfamily member 25 isoform X4 [Dama dama]